MTPFLPRDLCSLQGEWSVAPWVRRQPAPLEPLASLEPSLVHLLRKGTACVIGAYLPGASALGHAGVKGPGKERGAPRPVALVLPLCL